MSRIHQVNIWYVRSLGTVEEKICLTTGAREAISKGRLDGSRGIEVMRRLLIDDGCADLERYYKAAKKSAIGITAPTRYGVGKRQARAMHAEDDF
jgi:hypothetical protein